MIKTVRFFGTLLIGLAKGIEVISSILRLVFIMFLFVGVFIGSFTGVIDLVTPIEYLPFEIPLWANILSVVVIVGCFWLAFDKMRIEEKEYKKNFKNYL